MTAQSIETTATVALEQVDGGWEVTKAHLDVQVHIPGAEQSAFDAAAKNAKEGCPISKLLKAEITMDAQLKS